MNHDDMNLQVTDQINTFLAWKKEVEPSTIHSTDMMDWYTKYSGFQSNIRQIIDDAEPN